MRNRRGTDAQPQGDGWVPVTLRAPLNVTYGYICMYCAAFMKAQRPGGSKGDLRAWGI